MEFANKKTSHREFEEVDDPAWEEKVVGNYIVAEGENGSLRLKEIPASRKKRLTILKWLVKEFQVGVNYPEKQVNEIFQRFHPDCATLRREAIGYDLMARENGIYWRIG